VAPTKSNSFAFPSFDWSYDKLNLQQFKNNFIWILNKTEKIWIFDEKCKNFDSVAQKEEKKQDLIQKLHPLCTKLENIWLLTNFIWINFLNLNFWPCQSNVWSKRQNIVKLEYFDLIQNCTLRLFEHSLTKLW
jgi:hypothetical protein